MFAAIAIKGDTVIMAAVSERPLSGIPLRDGYDSAVFCEITGGYTDPNEFIASLSVYNGVLVSSLCDITVMSQEESELLAWRTSCKVTNFQAKAALLDADLLDAAEAAVIALGGKVKLSWDLEPMWSRMSNEINAIGAALGLEDDQIDALFKSAEMQ